MASKLTQQSRVDAFIEEQKKKYPGVIDIDLSKPVIATSTGIPVLDRAIGIGGIPHGYMVEIFGDEGVGKSSLAMIMAASWQRHDESILWIDMEKRFWGPFGMMCGIDPAKFTLARPDTGNNAIQIAKEATEAEAFGMIVIDSVAALVTENELKTEMGASSEKAQLSQLMSNGCKQLGSLINQHNTTIVWINQMRSKPMMGGMGLNGKPTMSMGKPEESAGGRALRFWASLRLELDKAETYRMADEVVGHKVKVRVVKNSWAPPFHKCFYDFRYKSGLDYVGSTIDTAIALGIIKVRGSWYDLPGVEKPFAGRKPIDELLRTNQEMYDKIAALIVGSEEVLEVEAKLDDPTEEPVAV